MPLALRLALALLAIVTGCRSPAEEAAPAPPLSASASAPGPNPSAPDPVASPPLSPPSPPRTITISGVGDCTLAGDFRGKRASSPFDRELAAHGGDLRYPFSGVLEVLRADDVTLANLETTLTTSTVFGYEASFHFRGKPEYARILVEGSVEVANVANNHIADFGERGRADTIDALRAVGVGVSGNGVVDRRTVRGVEIVSLGFFGVHARVPNVGRTVEEHKTPDNLVIVSFHWGLESRHEIIADQRSLGWAAIDAGADLVLGTHPHVIQAIEERAGRHVVYSLGNLVFGGNVNPADKEAIIYQETFGERDGRFISIASRVIPIRISTDPRRNDFRPVLLEGDARARVLSRIEAYSKELARQPAPEVASVR